MKTVKVICTTLLCFTISVHAFCQTKRIAHKSHSGKAHTFSRYSENNFGLPAMQLDSVKKTTDAKFIRYRSYGYKSARAIVDTLSNHVHFNNPAISVDSLRVLYPETKFIGFEAAKIRKAEKAKKESKKKPSTHR